MFRSILAASTTNNNNDYLVKRTKVGIKNAISLYMLTLMQSPSSNNDDEDSGATGDDDDKPSKKNVSMPDPFDTMHLTYLGGQLSVGALLGYSAGYAINVTAHVAAYFVGIVFISIQYLAWKGMVKIQWSEILDQAEKALDRDGDGKFDIEDAKIWWNDLLTILTWNMPGGSGFLFGLYYALS